VDLIIHALLQILQSYRQEKIKLNFLSGFSLAGWNQAMRFFSGKNAK